MSSSAEVFTLQSYEIDSNWEWISRFLARVKDAEWKQGDVRTALKERKAQLWGARDGATPLGLWITKLEWSGDTPFGLVWIAAGEPLEAGLELYREHTEPWFKAKGCEHVSIYGRSGWLKVLPDYKECGVILTKDLR